MGTGRHTSILTRFSPNKETAFAVSNIGDFAFSILVVLLSPIMEICANIGEKIVSILVYHQRTKKNRSPNLGTVSFSSVILFSILVNVQKSPLVYW